jgi:cation:H+ antiporter
VVGSNIVNVLLILGLSALIAPLRVASQLVRLDVPIMIGSALLVLLFCLDGEVQHLDGAVLFGVLVIYIGVQILMGKRESERSGELVSDSDLPVEPRPWLRHLVAVVAGLVLLVVGARLLVTSAVAVAQALGVSDLVIGLTVIAVGTSLPELATSVLASLRGERDIAVGNVVGSNVFNLLGVLGLSALFSPAGIGVAAEALRFDLPVMLAVSLACVPIFVTGKQIARWEGALFIGYFVAYIAYVVLAALEHDSLSAYSTAMLWFVLPLTAITLIVLFARHHLGRGEQDARDR